MTTTVPFLTMPPFSAEIVFLRAVTPLYPANQADIIFDITEGNLRDSFDILKRYVDNMTVGE
jgi:fibulin 1/2